MAEQNNSQYANQQNDTSNNTSNQQADPNATVGADMLGNEHPSGEGVNVGSGYVSGQPAGVPQNIANAEKAGKEFIPTGTGDPAAGVIEDPQQQGQNQQ